MKWILAPLSEVASSFIVGGTPSRERKEYWTGDIPWITGSDIVDGFVITGREYINERAVANSATNVAPEGSILLATREGAWNMAIAPADIAISVDIMGITLKSGFLPGFVMGSIQNRLGRFLPASRAARIKKVIKKDVEELLIPLSAPSEQRLLIKILDHAEDLRKKRTEADAGSARVLPALFYKMFGDPLTNGKRWKCKSLDRIASITNGRPTFHGRECVDDGAAVVRIGDFLPSGKLKTKLDEYRKAPRKCSAKLTQTMLREGDIVMAGRGDIAGRAAVVSKEIAGAGSGPGVIKISPDSGQVVSHYLSTYLSLSDGRLEQLMSNTTQKFLSTKRLERFPVLTPPLKKQIEFSNIVDDLITIEEKRRKRAKKIDKLLRALAHRAFTGDLTAKWRATNTRELQTEIERQEKCPEFAR